MYVLQFVTGTRSVIPAAILSDRAPKIFRGTQQAMRLNARKIKWMQHLNSSPSLVFLIIVFMILIWWMRAIRLQNMKKESWTLWIMQNKNSRPVVSNYFGEQQMFFLIRVI